MSKRDTSIDPRILQSAKEEFIQHGFLNASLQSICKNAEVTTGALYKRYRGKEELFSAVVQETINDLYAIANEKAPNDIKSVSDEQLIQAWDMDNNYMLWWFEFLYARKEIFTLILTGSQGSRYANFEHDWVSKMTESTYIYYKEAYDRKLATTKISKQEMEILLSAFWQTIYEPFIQGFTWQEILEHNLHVCNLFNWFKVLNFSKQLP